MVTWSHGIFPNRQPRKIGGGELILPPDSAPTKRREAIVALAAAYRLPAVYDNRIYADVGGLLCYNALPLDFRQVATYFDRILHGANRGELPVEAPDIGLWLTRWSEGHASYHTSNPVRLPFWLGQRPFPAPANQRDDLVTP